EARGYEARAARIERDLKRLVRLHERMAQDLNDAELPYEAGVICLRNGQRAEAARWFRNALQRDPRHGGARRGREEAARQGSTLSSPPADTFFHTGRDSCLDDVAPGEPALWSGCWRCRCWRRPPRPPRRTPSSPSSGRG